MADTDGIQIGLGQVDNLVAILPSVVVSGGVCTDDGSGNGKFNATACTYVYQGAAYATPAITSLATTNGWYAYVDPTTNTIKTAASIPSGGIEIASLAVSTGVVTATAARPKLATTTF